jgi:hypothetical protein
MAERQAAPNNGRTFPKAHSLCSSGPAAPWQPAPRAPPTGPLRRRSSASLGIVTTLLAYRPRTGCPRAFSPGAGFRSHRFPWAEAPGFQAPPCLGRTGTAAQSSSRPRPRAIDLRCPHDALVEGDRPTGVEPDRGERRRVRGGRSGAWAEHPPAPTRSPPKRKGGLGFLSRMAGRGVSRNAPPARRGRGAVPGEGPSSTPATSAVRGCPQGLLPWRATSPARP